MVGKGGPNISILMLLQIPLVLESKLTNISIESPSSSLSRIQYALELLALNSGVSTFLYTVAAPELPVCILC